MGPSRNFLCVALAAVCCAVLLFQSTAVEAGRSQGRQFYYNSFFDHHTKYKPTYVIRHVPVPTAYYVPFPVHVGGGGGKGRDKVIVVNTGGSGGGGGGGSGGGGGGGGGSDSDSGER